MDGRRGPTRRRCVNVIGSRGARRNPEYKHPFMHAREVKRVGYVIVSPRTAASAAASTPTCSDARARNPQWRDDGQIEVRLLHDRQQGAQVSSAWRESAARSRPRPTHSGRQNAAHRPDLSARSRSCWTRTWTARSTEIRGLQPVRQHHDAEADLEQLVPLVAKPCEDAEQLKHHWDYIYEPECEGRCWTRSVDPLHRVAGATKAVVENLACEQAARMVAMKSATDNAGDLIDELQLILQQGPPGCDHPGDFGDRRWRRGCPERPVVSRPPGTRIFAATN